MATTPMTMMSARFWGDAAADLRADDAADEGAHGDEQHHDPVDVVAREEHEHPRGGEVDDEDEDVLVAVEALERARC